MSKPPFLLFYGASGQFYPSLVEAYEPSVEFYRTSVEAYEPSGQFYRSLVEAYKPSGQFYRPSVETCGSSAEAKKLKTNSPKRNAQKALMTKDPNPKEALKPSFSAKSEAGQAGNPKL